MREAVFSSLEAVNALKDSRVLDLYAGSGALGLESASRGAAEVVLVEHNARAERVLKRNTEALREYFTGETRPDVRVVRSTVATFLSSLSGAWDVVFIDPPYELSDEELGQVLTAVAGHVSEDGIVVVERSSRSPEPSWPAGLVRSREKRYGETTVWFAAADVLHTALD